MRLPLALDMNKYDVDGVNTLLQDTGERYGVTFYLLTGPKSFSNLADIPDVPGRNIVNCDRIRTVSLKY